MCVNDGICLVLGLFTLTVCESVMSLFWVHKRAGTGVLGL